MNDIIQIETNKIESGRIIIKNKCKLDLENLMTSSDFVSYINQGIIQYPNITLTDEEYDNIIETISMDKSICTIRLMEIELDFISKELGYSKFDKPTKEKYKFEVNRLLILTGKHVAQAIYDLVYNRPFKKSLFRSNSFLQNTLNDAIGSVWRNTVRINLIFYSEFKHSDFRNLISLYKHFNSITIK